MYKELKIKGFRGFKTEETLSLAIPKNNEEGSGLTMIVGPNNSGKSTIWEAFKALSAEQVSFSKKRNLETYGIVSISIFDEDKKSFSLETINDGCEVNMSGKKIKNCFLLPSRRSVNPFFEKIESDKIFPKSGNLEYSSRRIGKYEGFAERLFEIIDIKSYERIKFDSELEYIFGQKINWRIDQHAAGQYYIHLKFGKSEHNSDGAGEGFMSVFTIVDALCNSKPHSMIIIDEPELSLHPALQKKISDLLMKYSKDRQIVIFTHSPFFINWYALANGAELSRTVKDPNSGDTKIYHLKDDSKEIIAKLIRNQNNPRILGLEAKEVFFLEDNVILTEGQDDVLYYREYFKTNYPNIKADFFGWGASGAGNIDKIASILKDLGFKKVFGIFDGDKETECKKLLKIYKDVDYKFIIIPADDVKDKEAVEAKRKKKGLFEKVDKSHPEFKIKFEYEKEMQKIVEDIKKYFK